MSFPISPTEGQIYKEYRFNNGMWKKSNSGKILQVLEFTDGTYQSFSTNAWIALKGTITPKSATSKILVNVHLDGLTDTTDGVGVGYGRFEVYGNQATLLRGFGYPKGWVTVDNASGTTVDTQLLHTPGSTNTITYDIMWKEISAGSGQQINRDGSLHSTSSIILTEIEQ